MATTDTTAQAASIEEVADDWLGAFSRALESGDLGAVDDLFLADGWWRDLLAVTGDLRSLRGTERIRQTMAEHLDTSRPTSFALAQDRDVELQEPDENIRWIEALLEFETAVGRGEGVLRLVPDGEGWRAWTLLTAMSELKGHEESRGHRRPFGPDHGERPGRRTWLEKRRDQEELESGEPQVVVIGAGQSGLGIAARLGRLGVETLVLERHTRVGDNWRKRYRSLVLHDPVWYDHMPYLPFPETWPVFTPKDKLAGWFEFYAASMELNVWTGTELLDSSWDDGEGRWTLRVRREDGQERELHPAHVVLATGIASEPRLPEFEGAEDFEGQVTHSSTHAGEDDYSGRKAIVVGACTSGHDIAQELYESGADVTLVQRSSSYVMSSEKGVPMLFGGFYEEGGPPTEEADLLFAGFPFPVLGQLQGQITKAIAEEDRELLAGLEAAGFKLDPGEDGGLFMKALTRGGGYYIDVGCSALISEGKVGLKQGAEVERFTRDGLRFADGTELDADLVVMATGYYRMRESARMIFGDEVADRTSEVWGLDDEGELRTIWRDSGHPGFWYMGGNLHLCRFFSRYLALQIKARLEGIALG